MRNKSIIKTAFSFLEMSMVILIIGFLVLAIATSKNLFYSAKLTRARALTNSSVVNGIKDLRLWLETTSSSSFPTEDPDDQSAVSTWQDINPQLSKNNATQSNSTNQPTYVRSAMNGLPAIKFDGSSTGTNSDYMDVGNFLFDPSTTDITVFIVAQFGAFSAQQALLVQLDGTGTGRLWLYATANTGTIRNNFGGAGFTGATVSKTPQIYSLRLKSGTTTIYINGSQTVSGSSTLDACNGTMRLGNWKAATLLYPLNGYMGEVIIFSRALSDFEKKQVETYLSTKWYIPLS